MTDSAKERAAEERRRRYRAKRDGESPRRVHRLKTWPSAYEAVLRGDKTFDYRRNDRDFAVGDEVLLEEWDPETPVPFPGPGGGTIKGAFSGRKLKARVSYILEGKFGVPPGYAVLALRDVEAIEG